VDNNRDFGSIIPLTWKHWPFIPGKNRGLGLFSVDSVSINIPLDERNVSLWRFPLPTEIDWQDLSRCSKDYYGISLSNFNMARPTGRLNRFFKSLKALLYFQTFRTATFGKRATSHHRLVFLHEKCFQTPRLASVCLRSLSNLGTGTHLASLRYASDLQVSRLNEILSPPGGRKYVSNKQTSCNRWGFNLSDRKLDVVLRAKIMQMQAYVTT